MKSQPTNLQSWHRGEKLVEKGATGLRRNAEITATMSFNFQQPAAASEESVACPFFMPEQRFDSDWPFPQRLPLGAGWAGTCTAPGHEGVRPTDQELKSGCNLGYAKTCGRLPAERHADAVRFALGEERDGILHVLFVCERDYLPAGNGELLYETESASWIYSHTDLRVQRMAECYVQAQRMRRANLFPADEIATAASSSPQPSSAAGK